MKDIVTLVGGKANGKSYLIDKDQKWLKVELIENGVINHIMWYFVAGDMAYFSHSENTVYEL